MPHDFVLCLPVGTGRRRTVVTQERLAAKLEKKSAANMSQQLRQLDGKSAITKMPEEFKHLLE
jgi:hypothetical protein